MKLSGRDLLLIASYPFRLVGIIIGWLMLEIARLCMRIAGIFIRQA